MKVSTKLRHWIALVAALATTVVSIIAFADFSGNPAPRWREIFMLVGPGLTLGMLTLNMALDKRDGKSSE
jgi:hypothetical protein